MLSPEKQALLRQRIASRAAEPDIPARPRRDHAPLSFAQHQMWVIDQVTPGNPAYNVVSGYRLRGALDVGALEASLNEVVRRHETLRTTFVVQDGEALQRIHPELRLSVRLVPLDYLDAEECEAALHAAASEESVTSFDLSRLPLIRLTLFRLAQTDHVLLINIHHIVADGLSVGLLLEELDTFYRSLSVGAGARPPELAVQYADFAVWQRQALAYPNELEFWRRQLAGALPVLELAGDRARPAHPSFRGSNVFFDLPAPLVRDLTALGAHEGCTLFMTLLAVFQVLLQRYSGAADIIIGTPVALRSPRAVEPLIGNFLNMAPLRCDVSSDPTFIELLRRTRERTLDAFSNSAMPFEAMVEQLEFERDPSRNPIFQTMLQFLSAPAPRLGDLAVSTFHFDLKIAQFDLSLHVYEEAGSCVGRFEYSTDLFDAQTIRRLCGHYRTLVEAVVREPQRNVSKLPMLRDAERHQLLAEWNDTAAPFPAALVHELFAAQSRRTPERTALVFQDEKITYRELDARASRMAQALRARGAGRGQRIGLCLERGADMLAAVLGVLKSGAAYVPLDPTFPEERLRFMAEDAQLALLVSSSALAGVFGLPRERQVLLDVDAAAIEAHSDLRPSANASRDALPDDPAYIIYTSGSTGTPKGVVVPHCAVVNFLGSMARTPGLAAEDVLLAVTTLSFDIAVLELQLPLALGATIVIASRDEAMDGLALKTLLQRSDATVMQATPTTWRLLLQAGWRGTKGFKALVGGEALPKDLAEQLIACGVELWNLYGPTETTVWSTCARITATADAISIGKPIANTTVYVLDEWGNLCPIGVPGELYIGGAGVTLGYWQRPQLTAERFVPDLFRAAPGERLYRTGDLARWRGDGTLEHLGRLDFQVKVRGFRIELGEIEANLASHPALREAVVVAREDVPGDPRLVAYVVPRQGEIGAAELKQHLSRRLPAHMVPSVFVTLQALPRTPNAKIDRKVLPAPARTGSEAPYTAPRGLTEETVVASWRRALQLERIGVHDNFFELGGRSLAFVRMISEINGAFGIRLGMAELIQNPTVEQFATLIEARQPRKGRPSSELDARQPSPSTLSKLVLLQEGRAELPVYFIYASPGELRLAQHMGASHRVFGIEAQWPMAWREAVAQNRTAEFPSLEQMVEPYVAELSAHAGTSPCVLAGFCYAGRIAFEAAHQLRKRGGKVEYVVLIDTEARPVSQYKLAWQIWRQGWRHPAKGSSANRVSRSLGSSVRNTWHTSWWLLGKARKKLQSYFNRPEVDLDTLSSVLDEQGMPVPWGLLDRLYREMDKTYRFRRLDSRGVLFRTGEFEGKQIDYEVGDALGWENLFTGGVEVIPVAGHHYSIWGSQIPAIAQEINRVVGRRSPNEREATSRGHQETAGALTPWEGFREGAVFGWWPGYMEWQSEYKLLKKEAEARGIRISSE